MVSYTALLALPVLLLHLDSLDSSLRETRRVDNNKLRESPCLFLSQEKKSLMKRKEKEMIVSSYFSVHLFSSFSSSSSPKVVVVIRVISSLDSFHTGRDMTMNKTG
jgi:hypothetical protein